MATRRTKKNRARAKLRQHRLPKKVEANVSLHYDTSLIIKDLVRTLISTLVVFGALVALYYQL